MLICCGIWVYLQCVGKARQLLWTSRRCELQPCQRSYSFGTVNSPAQSTQKEATEAVPGQTVRPPSPALQALVEHYSAAGAPQAVEQAVLHMDIASLDINQASFHILGTPDNGRPVDRSI